ncbi:MAG: preprotein translocase subunit SecE [Oscillospiraceae bacterium]|jgi:preprotein translocase subunit SecE|nr:preprotein translocase subunit SecE [Oscillospiraceae bacterium]
MAENPKKEVTTGESSEVSKKQKKAPVKKKPNFFVRAGRGISRWFREMRSELKKVQWPSTKQTVNHTATVIACVVVVGVFIWVFDWLAAGGAKALIALAQG